MELWKDIQGFEGLYQVSNYGRVKLLEHTFTTKTGKVCTVPGKIKKPSNVKGYCHVVLDACGKVKNISVHRLVARAFIPNPDNKPQVNHIDGNKKNNHVDNLEWVTGEENIQHAFDTGLMPVKAQPVLMDGVVRFDSITKCARHVGVDNHEIRRALQGKYKTVHGHTFAYAQ